MNLKEKVDFLKERELLKCMNRKELLDEHQETWQKNGITSFRQKCEFHLIEKIQLNDYAVKYTVELELNDHWSDSRCGEQDRQYG